MKISRIAVSITVFVAMVLVVGVSSVQALEFALGPPSIPVPNTGECTAGHDYWRTHSEYGPAPYDATWGALPSGADTGFYLSGQSYYEVLWTPPTGGNPYYTLARQYIAAELNVLSGASIPDDAGDAWDEAAVLFGTYTPTDAAGLSGPSLQVWTELTWILDGYNSGFTGPGACPDIVIDPDPTPTPVPNTRECTAGHGYWKTHSEYGPAPYDPTWGALPDGADTEFHLSGQSYYQVLWTVPRGGNAYYILARQYIAAELNMLSGAPIPGDAGDAWDEATALFQAYTPDEVSGLRGQERQVWTSLAGTLDDYNNGLTGPGVCPEVVIDPDPPLPPVPNTVECTAGYGYWKTHSEYGPAPYDPTWGALPDGADTPFFLSGQDYYEVLWTPPRGGNAYYILARAYISAELNLLNGAPMSEDTVAAWDEAMALFETYTPAEVGALKGNERKPWTSLASILSGYSSGLAGPGQCTHIYDVDVDMIVNKVAVGAGSADAVDVQLVVNAALALPVEYATDLNVDKSTDALDVQVVINDALEIES